MPEKTANTAQITGRAIITGEIVLDAPLLIGAGDGGRTAEQDILVLKDKHEMPFIPGTSLCGVLREFLAKHEGEKAANRLFGDLNGEQSMIVIDDISLPGGKIIVRDGVCIDGVTGIGVDRAKYDYEAVDRGTHGKFRLLITRRQCHEEDWNQIYEDILLLRKKMETGLSLGAITAKGFGRAHARNVESGFYDFHKKEDVLSWLRQKSPQPGKASDPMSGSTAKSVEISRDLIVEADFLLRTSVIVRDYDRQKKVPDVKDKNFNAVSLMSGDRYLLPGTSLKGVLSHHAEHILKKLGLDDSFLRDLMGYAEKEAKKKSRFLVDESLLSSNVTPAAQTRIRVDRFTGGVMDTALMVSEPLWQKENSAPAFRLRFIIKEAKPEEIGLALFLLRDLWQGRVAVGGEKSVGRGTLQGLGAVIRYDGSTYRLGENGKITEGEPEKLNDYAEALLGGMKKEAAK